MIIDCIIIAIANVHTITCPVCIKYRRQTVIWSERRNGFILSTRALGSARALWPGQARTLESLSESESVSHLRISARDHRPGPPPEKLLSVTLPGRSSVIHKRKIFMLVRQFR